MIESADSKRRGRLAKQGSRHLRWALVEAANHSHRHGCPDHELYQRTVRRCGRGRARLTVARKIARRSYHALLAAEARGVHNTIALQIEDFAQTAEFVHLMGESRF